MARLKEYYKSIVVNKLKEQFKYKNLHEVPRVIKVVINMGVGAAKETPKLLDTAMEELAIITGQRPIMKKAKKSISTFKLRKDTPIAVMVTLRQNKMYEFMDRLANIAIPRVRDFKGISSKGFDGNGNYTLGLTEQTVFPEISYDKIDKIKGMNITFVTTAKTDKESKALLEWLGLPFNK
ncbi:MAG: 50S ribosomal protein L5 [Deltaproteobacteria bacterium]|nr:50S ribosomal protein L5 [Deltaproteobacteria bacterium]MCL5791684.1 50S ribosomal protein L5 [Deltaproteobacteria bacterium]